MPSLALIFHCIDIADGKVKGNVSSTAERLAVDWCKYRETHARRIYAMAESPEHGAAVRFADKIKTKCLPNPFTVKDVYSKHWHGLKERQEVEAACNILIEENWVMMQKTETVNRSTTFARVFNYPRFYVKNAYPEVIKVSKPHLDTLDTFGYRHFPGRCG